MKYALVVILFLGCFSCKKKKEPEIVIPEPISVYDARSVPIEVPQSEISCNVDQITNVYLEGYRYSDPCVNPSNPYEFCFLRIRNSDQTPEDCDLLTYNFETNKTKFLSTHVAFAPDWSTKNWIIFTIGGISTELWKIKSNGDSLTKLISESSPQKPKWSPDGKKFVYYCKGCNVVKIADENGVFLKAINRQMEGFGWRSSTELLYFSHVSASQDICVYNSQSDSLNVVFSGTSFNENTWDYRITDNMLLHSVNNLLQYELNPFAVKTPKLIKSYSFLKNYNRCPNFANDKIISQVLISTPMQTEKCKLSTKSHISVMNADGTNERQILIPED